MKGWKQNAIRQMRRSRKATNDLLAKLSPGEIEKPRTQGDWSIKDVVAHYVAWEEVAVKRLRLIRTDKSDAVHYFDDIEEANRFNARAVTRLRKLTLKQILKRAEEVRSSLETELKNLPEDRLNDPGHRVPVYKWLPEFAWTHEADHRKRIQKWFASRRNARSQR
jgi:hypothetical protein